MSIGQDVHRATGASSAREWLIADGLGGSASGPVAGLPQRRTQALLTIASPHGRLHTLLLRFDERITVEGATHDPATAATVEGFVAEPWPTWRWRIGELVLEKSVLAVRGHAAVVVAWRHLGGPAARLAASPLLVARDPEGLQRETPDMRGVTQGVPGRVHLETVPDRPGLTLWHNGAFLPARLWKRAGPYALDPAGTAAEEALIPGHFEATLEPGGVFHVVASGEADLFRALAAEERLGVPPPRNLAGCVAAIEDDARGRARHWLQESLAGADFTARQAAAAHGGDEADVARRREPLVDPGDGFAVALVRQLRLGLARRGSRLTLVESLPAGGEYSESALRAVHALVTLRAFEPAREILRSQIEYLDEGLAPHAFDADDGRPLYGRPAPSLWLVSAVEFYLRRSGDQEFLRAAFPPLEGLMQAYRAGTRHGIQVGADGLLAVGDDGVAAPGLNALWHHAQIAMAQLARHAGRNESGAFYLAWARAHQERFNEALWDEDAQALRDPADAPDALLAAALAPSVLPQARALALLERLRDQRLIEGGLRAAPGDPRAHTGWFGLFLIAWLRQNQRSADSRAAVRGWLEPVTRHLASGAPGVPAAWRPRDGDGALEPDGDALSVLAAADLLRMWIEEMDRPGAPGNTPP